MELRCERGDGVFEVVIDSESCSFNWIVTICEASDAPAAGAAEGPPAALPPLLPPPATSGGGFRGFWSSKRRQKPTLVLDLDLTIAYCRCLSNGRPPAGGHRVWGVAKRPGLDDFLKALSPLYDIVLFTASNQSYADSVLQLIDPSAQFVKHRLYGHHLSSELFKDISMLGRDLERVVVIDDVPAVYGDHVGNVIRIAPFVGGSDDKLYQLLAILFALSEAKDVRVDIAMLKEQGALECLAK